MIELRNSQLMISFPEVHKKASMGIEFERTLRIPDDGEDHFLPPGLGSFPLRHVDDFGKRVPASWVEHGGVMLPMYQAEALWVNFIGGGMYDGGSYPMAVKIAAGKINAVTGEPFAPGLNRDPQDYMVLPEQPWLDGFCVEKGIIRQFVAMPLGQGYTAEAQVTGREEHGGIQITVYPMKAEAYETWVKDRGGDRACMMAGAVFSVDESPEMGLGAGGRMQQDIEKDPHDLSVWDLRHGSRCFVHIANSEVWRAITGEAPPTVPPTAKEYSSAELPWFDWYGDPDKAVDATEVLARLKSVGTLGAERGESPLPENDPVKVERVVRLGPKAGTVREGKF